MADEFPPYFRRDQAVGVAAPDLLKDCTYAEHIVHARGKRTQLTSISLNPKRIRDFGPTLYRANCSKITDDKHTIVQHLELLSLLRESAASGIKEERIRAIQAQRYAKRRLEGLVKWNFSTAGIERKDLIKWAFDSIQQYFTKA